MKFLKNIKNKKLFRVGVKNLTENLQVYRCNVCGNIVEVLHVGVGKLVCCGKLMELLTEKTEDVGKEKHVPVVEKTEEKIKVKLALFVIQWRKNIT